MTRGQNMRRARIRAGFTDLAAFAQRLGVEEANLVAWEADIDSPSDDQLAQFADLVGVQPSTIIDSAMPQRAQGICRAVDLVPTGAQAEALEQVGIPRALWRDSETWLAFLRLAQAVTDLDATQITLLAQNAEACVLRNDRGG